jgi:hypothetical protein
MVKKKPKKGDEIKPLAGDKSILVAADKPKAIKTNHKVKHPLTNAKLKALAKKRKPPQSWYEEDLDGI